VGDGNSVAQDLLDLVKDDSSAVQVRDTLDSKFLHFFRMLPSKVQTKLTKKGLVGFKNWGKVD
jgi:hypothetical protein